MTKPYYEDEWVQLYHGDCLEVLRTLPDESVHSVVTDPPYEISFMARRWDSSGIAYNTEMWRECLRILKPGGYLLAFGATRTWHRVAVAIEDAGFEIRDSISWIKGGGMAKGHNLGKAISAWQRGYSPEANGISQMTRDDGGEPRLTEDGKAWRGWAQALKPSVEPIVVARKVHRGVIPENVLTHGTGALNIDACRIAGHNPSIDRRESAARSGRGPTSGMFSPARQDYCSPNPSEELGRWPGNVALDGSAADELDRQHGEAASWFPVFQYAPKAGPGERPIVDGIAHPTVKPLGLMRWLVRLVTPPDGIAFDPFAGSGATPEACVAEGFKCIAIEREADYLPLIVSRLSKPMQMGLDFGEAS